MSLARPYLSHDSTLLQSLSAMPIAPPKEQTSPQGREHVDHRQGAFNAQRSLVALLLELLLTWGPRLFSPRLWRGLPSLFPRIIGREGGGRRLRASICIFSAPAALPGYNFGITAYLGSHESTRRRALWREIACSLLKLSAGRSNGVWLPDSENGSTIHLHHRHVFFPLSPLPSL